VTEMLELIPRQWKVIQHVREKFSCRTCETITQPPAPFHPIARGRAGPGLLGHVLFAKYGLHLPLNRQSATYAREGIDLDVSTLADWVGACAATLMPLVLLIRAHVFAAERIHADETTVPVQAKGQCRTGRLWTYVRDDRPFGGADPPAAAFFYSPDRSGKHPEEHLASYAGLMQADAYSGFNRLYAASRKPGPIVEGSCWAHARRQFFDLARINKAPIAIEAVERMDALFAIEREINGAPPHERRRVRNERSRPLVVALETWLREQRRKLSARNEVAKAIQYSLNRWTALTRFLDDGRLCMSNNAAERALRGIAAPTSHGTYRVLGVVPFEDLVPTRRSCSAQEKGSARASAVTVRSAGAVPSRRAETIRGDTNASGASSRTCRSTLPSRRAIAAKLAVRPWAKSSIHWRALAIAIRRASRRDGLIGVL
jgi:transposase